MASNERIHFRLIICPECSHNLCWVNPRLPNYCPECGKHIVVKVREFVMCDDPKASLRYELGDANKRVKELIGGKTP